MSRSEIAFVLWPRKRRRLYFVISLSSTAVLAILIGCAGMCRPSWYQPVSIDKSRIDSDRDALLRLGGKISDNLNGGRPIEFTLEEAQLNRMLVGREDIWPEAPHWQLEGVEDPVIDVVEDGLRLGATARARGGMRVIVSCIIRVEVDGERIRFECDAAGIGALPLPAGTLAKMILKMLRESDAVPSDTFDDNAVVLPNDWVWPNGKQRYQVTKIAFSDDEVRVTLAPLR